MLLLLLALDEFFLIFYFYMFKLIFKNGNTIIFNEWNIKKNVSNGKINMVCKYWGFSYLIMFFY